MYDEFLKHRPSTQPFWDKISTPTPDTTLSEKVEVSHSDILSSHASELAHLWSVLNNLVAQLVELQKKVG